MQRIIMLMLVMTVLGGCATARAPVNGLVYSDVKGPMTATSASKSASFTKGQASARSILGLVALGDASIRKAARDAGINKIQHVDYETRNFFGIVSEFTVVVYGNHD